MQAVLSVRTASWKQHCEMRSLVPKFVFESSSAGTLRRSQASTSGTALSLLCRSTIRRDSAIAQRRSLFWVSVATA